MKNLKRTTKEPKSFLQQIINSKKQDNKGRLQALQSDIEKKFDEYDEKSHKGELHTIKAQWDYDSKQKDSDGNFLYHQYDNSATKISALRADIIKENNGEIVLTCPVCERQDATDLDHYLPREKFPEYSIHPYNLIPTCHRCNNKKGELWCEGGARLIFNAYYDAVTDEALFDVKVSIENKLPKIILTLKDFISPIKEETRIALSTIDKLELLPLFNKQINEGLKKESVNIKALKNQLNPLTRNILSVITDLYTEMIETTNDINNLNKILYTTISQDNTLKEWIEKEL